MAKTTPVEPEQAYEFKYKKDYVSDWDLHRNYVQTFDELESMLIGQVYDSVSKSIDGSKITDSYVATLAIERSARVMGKLPDGVTESAGKADQGKAAFMDILRQKWIYPNANAQHPLEVKLEMWDLYSDVYGYMPMFYDWTSSSTGYLGPDCWLWNPRNLIPQQGKTSLNDMDYVTALTWVGRREIDNILNAPNSSDPVVAEAAKNDGWDREALQVFLDKVDNKTTGPDTEKDTLIARNRTPYGKKKGICIATRYEAGEDGEWVSFAPDHAYIEIRRIKNPHKNGRIPFVIKYSQPLYDSFYGLGNFQRAKPLQFARDGLINFYFKGIKMNLIPPIIANANGVVKHTLDYREGSVMLETIPNSIRRMDTSNAGLSTFQAAQSNLTGSLLALFGSQNASVPGAETLNPSQGKTPAAISLYGDKEATRDGQDRKRLEVAIEELTDGFFSLVVNIGTEDIPVALFSKDIQEIVKSGLPDVLGIFVDESGKAVSTKTFSPNSTQTGGKLTINPSTLKGVEYRFNIEPGSTAILNKQAQLQELENLMDNIAKFQNQFKDDARMDVNWSKIMETYSTLTSIPGADEFITINEGAPSPQETEQQQQTQEQQQQAQQQAQGQAQPASSTVQMPNGQVKEVADLVKLFSVVPEQNKNEILELLGLTPDMGPSPAATQQAAQHSQIIQGAQPDAQPAGPATPPAFVGGKMFHDPVAKAAAEHLMQLSKTEGVKQ